MAAFASADETSPTVATEYLPGNSGWAGMDGSGGSLNWMLAAWQGSGYTLSLGVPIIPTDSSGRPSGTLAQGATGAYNLYYVTLAQTLVSGASRTPTCAWAGSSTARGCLGRHRPERRGQTSPPTSSRS